MRNSLRAQTGISLHHARPRSPPRPGAIIGAEWEARALHYLEGRGLQLVARNIRCAFGEIDLIMRHGDCLVFIEVRYRRNERFGSAAESVNHTKQQRILLAAQEYLQHYPTALACRFDVIAITGTRRIEWLQDAFQGD
jgi:putative endonuclease